LPDSYETLLAKDPVTGRSFPHRRDGGDLVIASTLDADDGNPREYRIPFDR
jgi:hypothetical protein